MAEHKIIYCDACERQTVACNKCNNNCCNGGRGTLPDGSECDQCADAYMFESELWLLNDSSDIE